MGANTQSISLSLTTSTGVKIDTVLAPGHAELAPSGLMLGFSLTGVDGSVVGNYLLDSRRSSTEERLRAFLKLIGPYGLTVVENVVVVRATGQKMAFPVLVAVKKANKTLLSWISDRVHHNLLHEDHGYYDLATGRLVFPGTISLR
jgi:hypothetical protein